MSAQTEEVSRAPQRSAAQERAGSGLSAASQTFIANLGILAINFGTGVITARALGPDGRGELVAMMLWPQFFSLALSLGIPSALVYNLRASPDDRRRLIAAALFAAACIGALAALAGIAVLPWLLRSHDAKLIHFAQWLMLDTPFMIIALVVNGALQSGGRFLAFNVMSVAVPLITLLIMLACIGLDRLTPASAALAYILAGVPVQLFGIALLWQLHKPEFRELAEPLRRLFSYGVRSYGIDLLSMLSRQLDRVILVGLLSPALLGLYVVANGVAQPVLTLQRAAATVLFPRASGRAVGEVVTVVSLTTKITTFATGLAVPGLMIVAPLALSFFYGDKFAGAVTPFRILVVEAALGGAVGLLAQAFMAVGRPGMVAGLQAFGVALTLPLLLVLVPLYGVDGAAAAVLVSTAARLVMICICFPLVLGVPIPRPWIEAAEYPPLRGWGRLVKGRLRRSPEPSL